MEINLEKFIIKEFCQDLPFNWAPIEKDGICRYPNEYCDYLEKQNSKIYLCKKQTYSPIGDYFII